jgi:cytochrome c oxidase subunit 4
MATEHFTTDESSDSVKRKSSHEGPRNHFLAFGLSLLLTLLAFIAIIYQHVLETWFLLSFIVLLAILQAGIQAVFWMHLKDRGHLQQRIFIAMGAFIASTAIIMSVYWVWW